MARYCLSQQVRRFCAYHNTSIDQEYIDVLFEKKFLSTSLCTDKTSYSEMGSLLQGTGHRTVSLLFEEGASNVFGYTSLFAFLIVYFFLAILAAGSSIPAGLVIPMLTIGGCMGRIWALVVNSTVKSQDGKTPIDPGAWAQVF